MLNKICNVIHIFSVKLKEICMFVCVCRCAHVYGLSYFVLLHEVLRSWGLGIISTSSFLLPVSFGVVSLFGYDAGRADALIQISCILLYACCLSWSLSMPSSPFLPSFPLPLPSWLHSPRKPTLIDFPESPHHLLLCSYVFSTHVSLYLVMFYFVDVVPIHWAYFIWISLWRKC